MGKVGLSLVRWVSMGRNGAGSFFFLCMDKVWVVRLPGRSDGLSGTNKSKEDRKVRSVRYRSVSSKAERAAGVFSLRQSCPLQHHGVWKRESGLDRTGQVDGNYI